MGDPLRLVALCGFTAIEVRLFHGIFRVSATREQHYRAWDEGSDDQAPSLYLVKQGKPQAFDLWQRWSERFGNQGAPILEIGTPESAGWTRLSEHAGREIPSLLKPVSAKRLLDTLDELQPQERESASGALISDDVSLDEINAIDRELNAPGEAKIGRGKRVLVVDDSASLRLQMHITLEKKHGMRTDFAADGAAALRKLELRSFDIVFLDVMLPDMDGFEICRHIRREFGSKVPVVMLTSRNGRRDQLMGVLVQVDDYLVKPVAAGRLEQVLEKHLAG